MSVWKSDEKLLIFASLISSSKIPLCEVISSIRHSVSSPEETPRSSLKILGVSSGDETLRLILDLPLDQKQQYPRDKDFCL